MTIVRPPAALVIAFLALATHATVLADELAPPAPQYQDVLYLGATRPVVLRLHLLVDGEPFGQTWSHYARQLFAAADQDGDGRLSETERQVQPSADNPLRAELLAVVSAPGFAQSDINPPDGAISLPEFAAFVADQRGGAFQAPRNITSVQEETPVPASPVQNSNAGTALFKALDQQQDRLLSLAELQNAVASLQKLDFDSDGACSAEELDHLRSPFQAAQPVAAASASTGIPLHVLAPGEPSTAIVDRLLKAYGGNAVNPPDVLTIEQLGHRAEDLAPFDADHDGRLDFDELRYWVTRAAPHVELNVRIGTRPEGTPPVEVRVPPTLEGLTVKVTPAGLVSLVDGNVQLEFGVRQDERNAETLRGAFVQSFNMFDSDGNGYLDRAETARSPYFDAEFTRFDRDADGKMFEEEMLASAAGEIQTALSRTSVSIENRGQDLFEILDTSRDRRISQREFLDSLDRFSLWDANTDGQLAEVEVPQLYQLEFERGAPPLPSIVGANRRINRGANDVAMQGPVWFQRMDRNADGDVARDEFVGTPAQFDQLDANRDALIDAQEAILGFPAR